MDIHEYQAKELLAGFGVPVPRGSVAYSADQAVYAATELGGWHWAVKAQIHAGGRGKAGGVKLCKHLPGSGRGRQGACWAATLVTHQTGPAGKVVSRVYVEMAEPFVREIYLGFVLDRKIERIRVVASADGGMEIEEIAQRPARLASCRSTVEPAVGLQPFQAREIAFGLGLQPQAGQPGGGRDPRAATAPSATWTRRWSRSIRWSITKDDRVLALDAKMNFDDNALFRRRRSREMRDLEEEDPREARPTEHGLNYVGLDGDIGCIVNGAGLAMATMDMIKYAGGEPANFLDVGGGASPERVSDGLPAGASRQEHPGASSSTSSPASTAAIGWPTAWCSAEDAGLNVRW